MAAITELSELRKKGRASRSPSEKNDGKAALLFLAPWFVGLALIVAGPLFASLYLSLTDYDLLSDPGFIGLDNYLRMLDDPRLRTALVVTFTYVFVSVPLQLAAALLLALVLDRGLRSLAIYRSVNQVLALVGIEGQGWVSHPDYALGTLMILNVWTFGSPMIIFLAGLRQIPEMYYEAASIDGAGKLRQFRSITIPMLTPIIFFNLVLQVINAFQTFTQSYIVSNGTGGPVDSTLFYTLYLYQRGFGALDMGYASAMAWLLLIIIAGMTAVNFFASRYWVFYND